MGLGGSFWLCPNPESPLQRTLQACIDELGASKHWGDGVSDAFSCHATITSSVGERWLEPVAAGESGLMSIAALGLEQPEIRVKELVIGELFFKRIFLQLERTPSLVRFVEVFRRRFVAESDEETVKFLAEFDPHMSLAYARSFDEAQRQAITDKVHSLLEHVPQDLSDVMTHVKLMDTRSPPGREFEIDTAKSWTPCRLDDVVKKLKE